MSNYSDVAILFELDGTLVDSQDAEALAMQCFARQLGGTILAPDINDLIADRRMQEAIDMLCAHIGVNVPADALPRVRQLAEYFLERRLRCVPGVDAALGRIDHPKFVVSNSPVDTIDDRLSRTKLLRHFPGAHFSAYEYQTWKPAPDLYLAAIQDLGLEPDAAIAVEDSRVGVQAAVEAGLRVYWYQPSFRGSNCWVGQVRLFGKMSALPTMLEGDLPLPAHRRRPLMVV